MTGGLTYPFAAGVGGATAGVGGAKGPKRKWCNPKSSVTGLSLSCVLDMTKDHFHKSINNNSDV